MSPRVALVTLGCARNEVDSEELAARLDAGGYTLVDDAADADAVLVNTCGFVEAAKQDSIDTLLEASSLGPGTSVVAVGCLAERYGAALATSLPEATVLSFDHYADIATHLGEVLAGRPPAPHTPRDRRALLPISPVERRGAPPGPDLPPGIAPRSGPRPVRRRLGSGPVAPLKLASGCDRRCSFCAIPSFRGAFVSRPPDDVLAEAHWLAARGVREVQLVSENSTSYGKDLGDIRLLEKLLPQLAAVDGILRVRVAYLQPAEMRPTLAEVIATAPGVASYFDLSFQHASASVLRRMRRFGDTSRFLDLLAGIRRLDAHAGARSNVIVGFPGETAADYAELERFLIEARLDVVGVFGYSDEDGTEAEGLPDKVRSDVVRRRVERLSSLVETLTAERATERIGSTVSVLVESVDDSTGEVEGRAAHQAPDTDGVVVATGAAGAAGVAVGDLVDVVVTGSEGVDLVGRRP
jgi:ribosomal protein S12 methylthiotransferase RimO